MYPVRHTLPAYLEAPSLPEPTTALLIYKHLEYYNNKNISIEYKTITKHDSCYSWHYIE